MNSSSSPKTLSKRPAAQSALAASIRSFEEATKRYIFALGGEHDNYHIRIENRLLFPRNTRWFTVIIY
jgi:hypothetical protein